MWKLTEKIEKIDRRCHSEKPEECFIIDGSVSGSEVGSGEKTDDFRLRRLLAAPFLTAENVFVFFLSL